MIRVAARRARAKVDLIIYIIADLLFMQDPCGARLRLSDAVHTFGPLAAVLLLTEDSVCCGSPFRDSLQMHSPLFAVENPESQQYLKGMIWGCPGRSCQSKGEA